MKNLTYKKELGDKIKNALITDNLTSHIISYQHLTSIVEVVIKVVLQEKELLIKACDELPPIPIIKIEKSIEGKKPTLKLPTKLLLKKKKSDLQMEELKRRKKLKKSRSMHDMFSRSLIDTK